jgi:hypothetical protein
MVPKHIIFTVLFIFLTSCSVGKGTSSTPSATQESEKTPTSRPPSAQTPTDSNEAGIISITGTVQDVMLSARVILLREPIQGFSYLALYQDTKLVSAEGMNITLLQVRPGMRIKASGRPGTKGRLLTVELSILP